MHHRLFPKTTQRSAPVLDAQSWAVGRAAAELAQLDVRRV
jgi:hypothetical protein